MGPRERAALLGPQIRYTNKAFWRNPASAFFTFVFPLMFLVIFTALLGSGTVTLGAAASSDQSTLLRRGDGGVLGHHRLLHEPGDRGDLHSATPGS